MSRRALTGNADDPAQVEDARRRERQQRDRELNDFRVVLSLVEGRRLLWRLMGRCKLLDTPWAHDARTTDMNIGKGEIGRFLWRECEEAALEAIQLMQKEAMEEEQRDA